MKKTVLIIFLAGWSGFAQHEGHDHGGHDHDAHGHEQHAEEPAVELEVATGGRVERMVSFPAEVQVNRNRFAEVSPLYAGTLKKLFADIGDTVEEGASLAEVEARDTFSMYTVRSPLSGTVVSRGRSVGEPVGEGSVLFEVADLSSVWVEVHVFPQYRHAVQKGSVVHLTTSDGHEVETVIDYVSPLVDQETRTLNARCVLKQADDEFAPGSFVRAQIAVESVEAAVCVEAVAVQNIHGDFVVFVEDEHGLEPRDVVPGLSDGTFTEIKSGLKPGEKYVAYGAFDLKAELVTSGLDPHAGHGH